MPITLDVSIKPLSYDDFHSLDYEVMGIVFSIHQDLGRFWREKIYQDELAYRCQKAGIENVFTEVPIHVSYDDFVKDYKIDLLIKNAIYEVKTAQNLTGEHEKQTINYLMLTGLNHAKLINMRPSSVQYRFVSSNITPEKRYDFVIVNEQWRDLDDSGVWLKRMFKCLLSEWGVFLEVPLFQEAIVHFLGGEEKVVKEIDVLDGSRLIGKQKIHLIAPDVAFKISSMTKADGFYETHLRRFICFTPLRAIQWINLNHERVEFKTILN